MRPLATVSLDDGSVGLRRATAADLPVLVALLADDELGANLTPYREEFALVDADPAHLLVHRADARRFYARLGFESTHEGLKLQLPPSS